MSRRVYTDKILELIKSRCAKQADLARVLGYAPATFNHIIHHRKPHRDARPPILDPYKAPVLARHLQVSLRTILVYFGLPLKYEKILTGPKEVLA
jgi:hypothetical protein